MVGWKFWGKTQKEKSEKKQEPPPRIMIVSPTGSFPLGGAVLFTPDDKLGFAQFLSKVPTITDRENPSCVYQPVAIIYTLKES